MFMLKNEIVFLQCIRRPACLLCGGIPFNDAVSNSDYLQLNDVMMTVDQGCTNFPKQIEVLPQNSCCQKFHEHGFTKTGVMRAIIQNLFATATWRSRGRDLCISGADNYLGGKVGGLCR